MPYKILILNSSRAYENMFLEKGFELTDAIEKADLVQFTGGADVSPSYYGEQSNPHTGNNIIRDKKESKVYRNCLHYNIPMAGICRGGQFLNVMSGGKMWQHVDGHAINGTHPIVDAKTKELICEVSSTHHQMMRPFGGQVIATANEASFLEDARDRYGCKLIEHDDVEVVYFPVGKALCFQPHPEFHGVQECRDYYFKLLHKYLLTKPPKAERLTKTSITSGTFSTTTSTGGW